MVLRTFEEKDAVQVAKLFKSYFKTHTLFEQDESKIVTYVNEQAIKNPLIVYESDGKIIGALFLVNRNTDGDHKLWKFRHFAFTQANVGEELLKEAEKKVEESSKTGKVELTIAESEEGINFFKMQGYEQEGILKNHYRWGERTYILSKSFS
jgi:N-acetylglutamate synthase-like GNAT family acetyltransferase